MDVPIHTNILCQTKDKTIALRKVEKLCAYKQSSEAVEQRQSRPS